MSQLQLMPTQGQTFANTAISVENRQFIDCRFVGCTLVYSGGAARAENCTYENCRWIFQGPFAAVLDTLKSFGISLQMPSQQKTN
jgi:hypothetical protein